LEPSKSQTRPTIDIFGGFFKRRAIRRFLLVLSGHLAKDYGHRGPYTPAQVESTLRRYKTASPRYWPYAMAIFCDPDTLKALPTRKGEPSFSTLRSEIGSDVFAAADFSPSDVARYASEHGAAGFGDSADGAMHGHDGGGHH
jgi:hypothetical protein